MLLSHTRNANFINRIRVSMRKLADTMNANKHVHKENQTERLKVDEKGVQDVVNCFVGFECNQYDSTHTVATAIHSRKVTFIILEEGFATAHTPE